MNPTHLIIGIAVVVGLIYVARRSAGADLPPWRKAMLARADEHVRNGVPYQWGGGHEGVASWGLDCSGLIIDCAAAAGFRIEMNSNAMWRTLPPVESPMPGDLALFGTPEKAVHVMLVEKWHESEGRAECIGAQNGDSDVTTPDVAAARGAVVKRVPDHRMDTRFLGFRSLAPVVEGRQRGASGFGRFG